MLNVNEIRNLEDKWKKYKRKKFLKIFIYILTIFALVGAFLLYCLGYFDQFLIPNSKTNTKKPKSVLQKKIDKKEVRKTPLKAKTTIPTKKNNVSDINTNKITVKKENRSKTEKNSSVVIVNSKFKSDKPIKKTKNFQNSDILQLNTKFLSNIYNDANSTKKSKIKSTNESNKSENNLYSTKVSLKKQKREIVSSDRKAKKANIIISSKKIDKLKYLKERYNETGRAFYAILISKEYYKKRLYLKSLLWATTANSIDSSSEESWIMFAKNKVKLGKRNDAINALSAYLKVNNSKKIKILLTNIKNGVFK